MDKHSWAGGPPGAPAVAVSDRRHLQQQQHQRRRNHQGQLRPQAQRNQLHQLPGGGGGGGGGAGDEYLDDYYYYDEDYEQRLEEQIKHLEKDLQVGEGKFLLRKKKTPNSPSTVDHWFSTFSCEWREGHWKREILNVVW